MNDKVDFKVSEDTHETHHLFIRMLITKEERRQARIDSVVEQVLGEGAISFLLGLGALAYEIIHSLFTHK